MIPDGYTIHRTFSDLEWTLQADIRPMLAPERQVVGERILRYPIDAGYRIASEAMIPRIVAWSEDDQPTISGLLYLRSLSGKLWNSLLVAICGDANQEAADRWNLFEGTKLELTNPKVARVDCSHCQVYWHDPITGSDYMRAGQAVLRPADAPPLCRTTEGCPKGTPTHQKSLSPKNRMAFEFHRRCSAVGRWPDDPIVARNALVIREAMKAVEKERARGR